MQIVHLLNDMYVKFDELTNVHNVYKVRAMLPFVVRVLRFQLNRFPQGGLVAL